MNPTMNMEKLSERAHVLVDTLRLNDERITALNYELFFRRDFTLRCLEARDLRASARKEEEARKRHDDGMTKVATEIVKLARSIQQNESTLSEMETAVLEQRLDSTKLLLKARTDQLQQFRLRIPLYAEIIHNIGAGDNFGQVEQLHTARNKLLLLSLKKSSEHYAELCAKVEEHLSS